MLNIDKSTKLIHQIYYTISEVTKSIKSRVSRPFSYLD